ncbi:MAG TPA: hypothetical protein PLA31_02385 [Clostridia bacterium]|jgi:hypothetical protein|nr:hypothetical protein [Clostridia bacterium]
MKDKIKAVELLTAALEQVDKANDAIDAFADAYGLPKPGGIIRLEELAYLVGKQTGVSPFCAEEVIRAALHLVTQLDLRVAEKEDGDDE